MAISTITDSAWKEILDIQREAYSDVLPEEIDVLKSKWHASPDTCLIYSDNDKNVQGYILAHPWANDVPPRLHEKTPATDSNKLFLHDLALARRARGAKIATQLVELLINKALENGFSEIRLVAIQNSNLFWEKLGFTPAPEIVDLEDYGDCATLMKLALEPQ